MTTKLYCLIAVLFLHTFIQCTAQDNEKFNLDFENFKSDEVLSNGWFKWGTYALSIDSTIAYSGKYSGKIESDSSGSAFGSIAYRIPANYEGTTIQLEGFMKTKNVQNGFAGLLLRIDGNGQPLAFDNMEKQKIVGSREWQKYTVTTPYPEGAEVIFVAGILAGKGEAWFDHFEITIDGNNIQTLEEADNPVYKADSDTEFYNGSKIEITELTPELIENLDLLGKIWGFLKYHHPEIAKGNYNWDYELFRLLPKYSNAGDRNHRDKILIDWIDSYGEIEECKKCTETTPDAFLKPDQSWMTQHGMNQNLINRLKNIYQNRNQGRHFYIRLVANIGNPEFKNENSYSNMPYPDNGFRLLALYKYWNMIQYFFPNRHLIEEDWNSILKEYIPIFLRARNELEYELAAIRIIGDITDTHANLWGGKNKIEELRGNYFSPCHLRFIEDKLVVTDYYNPELKNEAGLEIGDIISRIDGREVTHIVDSLSHYYPASNKATRLRDISADMLRSTKDHIKIEYLSRDKTYQKKLQLYPRDSLNIFQWYKRDDEKSFKLLDGNIGYINLKNIKNSDVEEIKKSFIDAKGIIIDIRNYPSTFVPFLLGSYFVSTSAPFVKFTNGNIDNPGEFTFTPVIEIPPDENSFKGKLVVLVNEISQSQAEYTAMAFRAGDNTTIIGSTTAGADGNISVIFLPGGLRTMISGIGVYYPNGKDTQRVGIVPDLEIKPTIKGIKNGNDELLEKAIEIINEQKRN